MIERTEFGPGYWARVLYFLTGSLATGLAVMLAKFPWEAIGELYEEAITIAAVLVFSSVCAGAAARTLSRRHKKREQAKRDARAAGIMKGLREETVPDFALYLRAFETTAKMPYEAENFGPALDGRVGEDAELDFETAIAEAVESAAPLVALGQPGEHIGAGRILTTDDQWQADLALLAGKALVLFMLPSLRPGTLWEIDRVIAERWLEKTIWLQPPMRRGWLRKLGGDELDWAAVWNPIAAHMRARGIEFPDYDPKGCIFTIDSGKRLKCLTGLDGSTSDLGRPIDKHLTAMSK